MNGRSDMMTPRSESNGPRYSIGALVSDKDAKAPLLAEAEDLE